MDEYRHTFNVVGFCLNSSLGSSTGASTGSSSSRLGLGSGCDDYRLSGGSKLEVAASEFIIGTLVLKENNFTECFSTKLKSDRAFDQR